MPNPELSQSQIDEMRVMLKTRWKELEIQLQQGEGHTRPVALDQQSVGRVSRIDAIQQQQIALASKELTTRMLRQVELALQRIELGSYGFCLHCEKPIAFARLQAQPFANLCLDCQSASENA
jgi:DnaK suppressor protein